MKEFKTFNQQLTILRKRGMIVPQDGRPKRFLEQENYYNVINGYKELFLKKDSNGVLVDPEEYNTGTHFNELKALFLFDRELRTLFLKYILIFENSLKTTISYEFSKKYRSKNAYLDIDNYVENNPKKVLNQISILTKTIHDKVDKKGAIKHYIEEYGHVPLWVLTNYLTMGNLSYLYSIFKDSEKNLIAKFYADKHNKQYAVTSNSLRISSQDFEAGLKVINLVRNICAHEERLYNSDFGETRVANLANFYGIRNYNNRKLVVAILFLKAVLDKKYFQKFIKELVHICSDYSDDFVTVKIEDILEKMGISYVDLKQL